MCGCERHIWRVLANIPTSAQYTYAAAKGSVVLYASIFSASDSAPGPAYRQHMIWSLTAADLTKKGTIILSQ